MAVGLVLGAVLVAPLLRRLGAATSAQLLFVTIGVMLGAAFMGQALGLLIGGRLHATLPGASVRKADRVAGAAAGVIGVVVGIWLLVPLMADVPGRLAAQARGSVLASLVTEHLPDPPDTVDTLRRLLGEDRFPRVFDALDRAPDLGPPPAITNISQAVVDAVVPSTVKVQGTACRQVQEGSGFVVRPGLVVTNAHVVAGEGETVVELSDGSRRRARVVAFDPERDIAILGVPGLDRPSLALGTIDEGGVGAVFGHPAGGQLRAAPFLVGDSVRAVGTDIYDSKRTERRVLILAAELHPGDSGAALIDPRGQAVGIAFAIAPDRPEVAYALAIEELEAVLAGDLSRAVATGPCLS
jgi:S1-C subfamily serine protease